MPTPTPTPLDVVRSVAQYLLEEGALAALSSLSTMSKGVYLALVPGLYANLLVNGRKSDALFDLDEWDLETALQSCTLGDDDQVFLSPRNPSRRVWVLSHVKNLKIESYPSASTSLRFLSTVKTPRSAAPGMPERPLLLPRLEMVSLSPTAVDALRTFVPDDWDRPHSPPFLEALTGCSSPAHLCIAFRVVCSDDWEEHREMTTPGAYQLISRLNQLRTDGWTSLRTFTVHDVVHQVLPSLAGCTNIYQFSPHVAPEVRPYGQAHHPPTPVKPYALNMLAGRDSRHRDGKAGCGIPGPQWNFRSWQINSAIKNLFPSGTNSRQALAGTKWQFVNISGHVLKKVKRDDDDETGVGADEVEGLVEGLVKSSLPQDLPAREGFSEDLVGEVFDRISYRDGVDQCQACARGDWSAATISSLRDLKVDERRMPVATHFPQPPRHVATAVIRKKVRITTSPWGRPVDTNYLYQ